ncbi:MAG: biotin/lipoyl-binding protein, partial [Thermoguttaceae bacterium]
IIVEQIEDSRVPGSMVQRVDVVAQHSATALGNAMEHQSLFLMPLWRALGKTRWVLRGRTLPKTILITAAVVGVIAFLVFFPADFELESKGTLEPIERYNVFAGIDGVVTKDGVKVIHGQLVKKGQILVELRNTDLDIATADIKGELLSTGEKILGIARRLNDPQTAISDKSRLRGERAALKEELASLIEQLRLYNEKKEELKVRSPADGLVLTWNPHDLLDARPVHRGQVLLEVANPEGEWQLELQMPEDNMGHIAKAHNVLQEEAKSVPPDKRKAKDTKLPVTFILRTEPGKEYTWLVEEMHLASEVHGEEGTSVLIKVRRNPDDDNDKNEIDKKKFRAGAEVSAKVYCGRRSIGYVWLHDPIEFIQSRILFKL